mmetsp:Transcript_10206/g.14007  ORF Transcript_10206/g.14007 Transcript_10206/m.14007 type:complete len:135 (-) Transcript_10206:185-589(-)
MLRTTTIRAPRFQPPSVQGRIQSFATQKHAPPSTIRVPWLGTSTHHGTVEKIEKKLGQFVKKDDPVLTIKTDQGAFDIKAPQNGVIVKLNKNLNDVVLVGNDLFELDGSKSHDINPTRIKDYSSNQPSNTGPQS